MQGNWVRHRTADIDHGLADPAGASGRPAGGLVRTVRRFGPCAGVGHFPNGTWTRAPTSLAYQNDGGDIALYYLTNTKASASGLQITVSASSATYLDGTVAEYSGVAQAGALDQIVAARGVGTSVNAGGTASVPAGELVYSAVVTGQPAGGYTPGSSQGIPYTTRISAQSGSVDESTSPPARPEAGRGPPLCPRPPTGTQWPRSSSRSRRTAARRRRRPGYPPRASPPAGWRSSGPRPPAASRAIRSTATKPSSDRPRGRPSSTGGHIRHQLYVHGCRVQRRQSAIRPVESRAGHDSGQLARLRAGNRHLARVKGAFAHADPVPASQRGRPAGWLVRPVQRGRPGAGFRRSWNGTWTRAESETFGNGTGDIALYYLANTKAAPNGLTVTISASAPAYLQESIAEFSGVSTTAPLDQAVVDRGSGITPTGGTTAAVPAGELAVAGLITGGQPGTIVPGTSQQVPYVVDVQNGSASADMEDILSTAAGTQTASDTLGAGSDWYMVVATFRPASWNSGRGIVLTALGADGAVKPATALAFVAHLGGRTAARFCDGIIGARPGTARGDRSPHAPSSSIT